MIKNKMSFEDASAKALSHNLHPQGIGEYKEKVMHSILKNYYEEDLNKQEIKIDRFYCDILNENGIIEIQTANFNMLREKLKVFLESYDVTIVYPLVHNKFINWANSNDDYMRKSPRHDSIFKASRELYKIKMFLNNPKLHFMFVFCDMIELKNLDGWNKTKKKGASSIVKIPNRIEKEVYLHHIDEMKEYINNNGSEFSASEFAKMNKVSLRIAQLTLNILKYVNAVSVERIEKRKYIYKINHSD